MKKWNAFIDEHGEKNVKNIGCEMCKMAFGECSKIADREHPSSVANLAAAVTVSCPSFSVVFNKMDEVYISEEERNVLKCLDSKYKYIARDKHDQLLVFTDRPYKSKEKGEWIPAKGYYSRLPVSKNLFDFINFYDKNAESIGHILAVSTYQAIVDAKCGNLAEK